MKNLNESISAGKGD